MGAGGTLRWASLELSCRTQTIGQGPIASGGPAGASEYLARCFPELAFFIAARLCLSLGFPFLDGGSRRAMVRRSPLRT